MDVVLVSGVQFLPQGMSKMKKTLLTKTEIGQSIGVCSSQGLLPLKSGNLKGNTKVSCDFFHCAFNMKKYKLCFILQVIAM